MQQGGRCRRILPSVVVPDLYVVRAIITHVPWIERALQDLAHRLVHVERSRNDQPVDSFGVCRRYLYADQSACMAAKDAGSPGIERVDDQYDCPRVVFYGWNRARLV